MELTVNGFWTKANIQTPVMLNLKVDGSVCCMKIRGFYIERCDERTTKTIQSTQQPILNY